MVVTAQDPFYGSLKDNKRCNTTVTRVLCAGLEMAYKTKRAWDTLPAPKPSLRELILPVGRKIMYSSLKEEN